MVVLRSCPIATAPLGFEETFLAGREDFSDKTYTLVDKAGRKMMLAPDSSPLVIRWIGAEPDAGMPRRNVFVSPVFRYRNQKYRYFRHIGFSFANCAWDVASENLAIVTLSRLMSEFFIIDCSHPISMSMNDFGIWHLLLQRKMPSLRDRRNLLHRMRFPGTDSLEDVVVSSLKDKDLQKCVVRLYEGGYPDASYGAPILERAQRLTRLQGEIEMKTSVNVEINFSNFHGSETQSSIAIEFRNSEGQMCGDGGCYSDYARSLNPCMSSFFSFATGLEYLIEKRSVDHVKRSILCILAFPEVMAEAQALETGFQRCGIPTIVHLVEKSVSSAERQISSIAEWIIVLGLKEIQADFLEVRNISTRTSRRARYSDLVGRQSYHDDRGDTHSRLQGVLST